MTATTTTRLFATITDLSEADQQLALLLAVRADSDREDRLAALLGLAAAPEEGTDGLFECEHSGCHAWFWREDGAAYNSPDGERIVCAEHAVKDDPDVAVHPGSRLAETWREQALATESHLIRTTGSSWGR